MIQYTIVGAPSFDEDRHAVAYDSRLQEQREPTENLDHFCIGARLISSASMSCPIMNSAMQHKNAI
jgi:hypothetical protein